MIYLLGQGGNRRYNRIMKGSANYHWGDRPNLYRIVRRVNNDRDIHFVRREEADLLFDIEILASNVWGMKIEYWDDNIRDWRHETKKFSAREIPKLLRFTLKINDEKEMLISNTGNLETFVLEIAPGLQDTVDGDEMKFF